MTSTRLWDRAADLPMVVGRRPRPEIVALPADDLPTIAELFTFMRDAELRFDTLRMRIDEMSFGVDGEQHVIVEVAIRHPSDARVTTTQPALGTTANYELWISDGEIVRTYSAPHKLGTERPVRRPVVGVSGPESRDLPGTSRVYAPLTALPMETLPEAFVHPAGYCQNVLATGTCRIAGLDEIAGREAIVLVCDHPRPIGIASTIWVIFIAILFMLPQAQPITISTFNYTPVVLLIVIGGVGLWWLVSAKNWFKGPKVQGTAEELAAIERDLELNA
jgi:hypothetical protein